MFHTNVTIAMQVNKRTRLASVIYHLEIYSENMHGNDLSLWIILIVILKKSFDIIHQECSCNCSCFR